MMNQVAERVATFRPEQSILLAKKYDPFKTPDESIRNPQWIGAQVMEIGDLEDVFEIENLVGHEYMREVLVGAEPGTFRPKSWHFWHYRLGLAECSEVPPMPSGPIARRSVVGSNKRPGVYFTRERNC
jgi:hypothetical protein